MTTPPHPEPRRPAAQVRASTVLITGAATGMGALASRSLAARGHTVYASMRDPDGANAKRAAALRDGVDGEIRPLELDVLDDASVDAAVGRVIERSGRLDVLVNNAGHMYYGITEAFTPDELMSSYATNCAGAHRVTRAVLPHLRRQRGGLLLWVGSGSTRAIPPYLGPYSIAKAAFDALAESFAWDVESLGVDTTIIHPGIFTEGTSHFADAARPGDAARASEYDGTPARRHLDSMLQDTERLFTDGRSPDPQIVADEIVRIVELPAGQRPRRTVADGSDYGAEIINGAAEELRIRLARRMHITSLLGSEGRPIPPSGALPA
jgi:NAD(P)-dependent dehydrogenase (short-subunit alcohol dehydrogenase family)